MSIEITSDDLIRFIYKETQEIENRQIKNSIYKNSELKQEYDSLKKTCKFLNVIKFSPDDKLISRIIQNSYK